MSWSRAAHQALSGVGDGSARVSGVQYFRSSTMDANYDQSTRIRLGPIAIFPWPRWLQQELHRTHVSLQIERGYPREESIVHALSIVAISERLSFEGDEGAGMIPG